MIYPCINQRKAVSVKQVIVPASYSDACFALAQEENDSQRKAELELMADSLGWIMKHPCRNFHDAIQCIYLYHIGMCLDGQQHGISFGRVDQ